MYSPLPKSNLCTLVVRQLDVDFYRIILYSIIFYLFIFYLYISAQEKQRSQTP